MVTTHHGEPMKNVGWPCWWWKVALPSQNRAPSGAVLQLKNGKSLFCVEAQKILYGKVACIGELHNTAKNRPKIRLYGVELELRKVVRDECHVKSCLIVMCVKVPPQTMPKTQVLNCDVLVGHKWGVWAQVCHFFEFFSIFLCPGQIWVKFGPTTFHSIYLKFGKFLWHSC